MLDDLLSLISRDTKLGKVASTKGGEYAGPCPFCGGTDRFHVWPHPPSGKPRWKCLGAKEGRAGCGKGGDTIAYLVERGDLTPTEAGRMRHDEIVNPSVGRPLAAPPPLTPRYTERLAPPDPVWQEAARAFVAECKAELWAPGGEKALAWLHNRGLTDETIKAAGLGYNAQDRYEPPETWGLEPWTTDKGKPGRVWLPQGWVIPWMIGVDLWRVNIRRPNEDLERDRRRNPEREPAKYIGPKGAANGLYNADALSPHKPAILVEGEFDALILSQVTGDLVTPVATGSTAGSRSPRWITALSLCSMVLVAYDADEGGEKAATWWVRVVDGKRWRPFWEDANAMHQDGVNIRHWVEVGLDHYQAPEVTHKLTDARGYVAEADREGIPSEGVSFPTRNGKVCGSAEGEPMDFAQPHGPEEWTVEELEQRLRKRLPGVEMTFTQLPPLAVSGPVSEVAVGDTRHTT